MPYHIEPYLNGYVVKSINGHYLSNHPLSYEQARKQMIAVGMREGLIGGGGNWSIHSVIFKKPYDYFTAFKEASNIYPHNYYTVRETKQSYRFSVDKNLFKKFRTKKINDKISMVYGELK